jgi:hypothetical protein
MMANSRETQVQCQGELHSTQQQIYEKKTSILDSTRRMLGLINESETIGHNTATVNQQLNLFRLFACANDYWHQSITNRSNVCNS